MANLADTLRAEKVANGSWDEKGFLDKVVADIRENGVSNWTIKGWFHVDFKNKLDSVNVNLAEDALKREGFRCEVWTKYNGETYMKVSL